MTKEPTTLPLAASDVTDEWLTSVLRRTGATSALDRVTAVTVDAITSGASSTCLRVTARVSDGSRAMDNRLIVKLPTTNESIASANRVAGWFRHEVNFYRTAAPRLGLATPRCYFARAEPNGQGVLVLGDLAGDTALTPGSIDAGCTRLQAEGVLKALAALHQPANMTRLASRTWPPPFMHIAQYQQGADPRAVRWSRWFAENASVVGARARRVGESLAGGGVASFRRVAETSPCLLHGDCKADNMFFRDDGTPIIFDWQLVSRGSGAFDVAFFLSTSVAPRLRSELETTRLRAYHADTASALPYDAWFDLYRHCVNVAFYRTATSVALHASNDAVSRHVLATLTERQCAAIEELRADDTLTSTELL